MLHKTKWYIVDLDTRRVQTGRAYARFWEAVDAQKACGTIAKYTALRGSRILTHPNTWIMSTGDNGHPADQGTQGACSTPKGNNAGSSAFGPCP